MGRGRELDAVDELIGRYDLHATAPVDLAPIRDLYTVQFVSLSSHTLGCAYIGDPESAIIVNSNLNPYQQRMVLAHEASHILLRHPASFHLCQLAEWLYVRYEQVAQQGAARILISRSRLADLAVKGATVQEMSWYFQAPEVLIEMRLRALMAA
jgi:Zn-dependent peptidase ImmA (M78 family)